MALGTGARHAGVAGDGVLDQLRADHLALDELFTRFEATDDKMLRRRIVEEIALILVPHATAEEELFYPALQDKGNEDAEVDEAYTEHAAAKKQIENLLESDPGDMTYAIKLKTLASAIRSHVKEEETILFQDARDAGIDLAAMDKQVAKRKAELRAVVQQRYGIVG